MQRMSKVHVWAGFTEKTQKEFEQYFDQRNAFLFDSQGNEKDDSEIISSQFGRDLGKSHSFDEDFLTIYYNPESEDLDLVLEGLADVNSPELLVEACGVKGITKANAMFFYTDAELQLPNPDKKYNDLTYIGVFDWNI